MAKATTTSTTATTSALDTYTQSLASADADSVSLYRALDSGDKSKARVALVGAISDAVNALDLDTAQRLVALQKAQAGPAPKATVEVDYQDLVAQRIAYLRNAADLLATGEYVPVGFPETFAVADDIDDKVSFYAGQADQQVAIDLATAKITTGSRRAPGDTGAHIVEALGSVPAGTVLTVAQIRAYVSESYPQVDARPSAGGITDRLKKGNVEGVKTVTSPVLGARLA